MMKVTLTQKRLRSKWIRRKWKKVLQITPEKSLAVEERGSGGTGGRNDSGASDHKSLLKGSWTLELPATTHQRGGSPISRPTTLQWYFPFLERELSIEV